MRIDASNVLGQGGFKVNMSTGATNSLKEGDVIRAEVVSADKNGTVSLKMENGQSFSAKLGADVKLSPGDVALLEVTGKEKGQVSLSFAGVENADDDLSLGKTNLVKDFTDKSLAPFANKLAQLNMPVTEESARMMRDIIAQNPKLSMDEAAFLASNKLTGDENLMKAALSALANGDKTDAMIARLMSLINEQTSVAADGSKLPNTVQTGNTAPGFTVNTANSAPLTDLITTIVKNFSGVFEAPGQATQNPSAVPQAIITQPNTNMQINAQNAQEILQTVNSQGESASGGQSAGGVSQGEGTVIQQNAGGVLQGEGTVVQQNTGGAPQGEIPAAAGAGQQGDAASASGSATTQTSALPGENATQGTQSAANPAAQTAATPETAAAKPETIINPETTTNQSSPASQSATQNTTQPMSSVVAQLLSDIPQFSGTPQSALHRFSEMLLRVAGESADIAKNTENLAAQLDKLFTRISKDDTNAGARLRDAREELFTRLSLIEEAISRAAQPARAEMLVQTQKLMDHVRLLNSIEQFVYMQLPVQLSEEKKSADLYVFKRKGGKRADPDNVNILLAIDLEFMGHWEALLNIKNKEVSIQMEVPGEAEKEHFNANTVLLHNMLHDAGFKLVSTNIKFSEEETTPLTALSAFDRYTGGKQGIIDFKI